MRNKTSSAQKKSFVMRTPKIKKVKGWAWLGTHYKKWHFQHEVDNPCFINVEVHKAILHIEL